VQLKILGNNIKFDFSRDILKIQRFVFSEANLLINLLFAFIIFAPVFLGFYYMPGTDLLFNHFPNLILGYDEYNLYGTLPRWTEFAFHGFDYTRSMHAHWFNPILWPIFLIPKAYILHFFSLYIVLFNCLTGFFWHKISNHLLEKNSKYSIFVGLLVQCSSFYWWNLTAFASIQVFLFSSILIYLILTKTKRSFLSNLFFMSFAFSMSLCMMHPGYLFPFLTVPFLLFIFGFIKSEKKAKYLTLVLLTFIIGILFNLFRLYLIFDSNVKDARVFNNFWSPGSATTPYFLFTAFNSLLFGATLHEAVAAGKALLHPGSHHTQIHSAIYFGTISLILFVHNLIKAFSHKKFLLFIIFILSLFFNAQSYDPLNDLQKIIYFPFSGANVHRIFTFYSFIFLFIFCLKDLNQKKFFFDTTDQILKISLSISFFIVLIAIGMYFDLIYEYISNSNQILFYLKIFINILIIFISYLIFKSDNANIKKYFLMCSFFIATLIFLDFFIYKKLNIQSFYLTTVLKNLFLYILIIFLTLKNVLIKLKVKKPFSSKALFFVIFFLISLSFYLDKPSPSGNFAFSSVSILGWIFFIFNILIYALIFYSYKNKWIKKQTTIFYLLSFIVLDNLVSFQNYTFVNIWSKPYYSNFEDIYPNFNFQNILINNNFNENNTSDILNSYSINHPTLLTGFASNEVLANLGQVYRLQSYGGVDSITPFAYRNFIKNLLTFAGEETSSISRAGLIPEISNNRILEILGVYIDFDKNSGKINTLPNAVPKFSIYKNFQCLNEIDSVDYLLRSDFNPRKTIIINEECRSSINNDTLAEIIHPARINSQHYKLKVSNRKNYYLNFNNNLSPYWKAYWNDTELDIKMTNGHSMAVLIPENEEGTIDFKFQNTVFENLFLLTKIMIIIFMILFGIYFLGKKSHNKFN